ncbi:MAG: hypothetical protein ABFD50_16505 [Smithella sp.]
MNKNYVLIRDVVNKYHPDFKDDPKLQAHLLKYHDVINVERLIEYTLASVGDMKFVDEEGYDFLPCYSDSKTVSISRTTRDAYISSVENKIGALRITAYNPHRDRVDFFYVPKEHVPLVKRACYGKSMFKQRIMFCYSEKDHYNSFEKYRVPTFVDLATANY